MNGYLLQLSIGPVQDFIAAARRTRDLWCGSLLLSEVSKAAARCLAESDALLIFPALEKGAPELEPYPPGKFNVANIILAEVPPAVSLSPKALADKARAAAQTRFLEISDEVKHELKDIIDPARWENQMDDVIEFYSAWCVLDGGGYKASRARLRILMDGRKACRNFLPANGEAEIPKSSLDGARESVFSSEKARNKIPRGIQFRLRLSRGEQLDAIGFTKRLGFGPRTYPSVSRIAVDPWIRGLAKSSTLGEEMEGMRKICEELHDFEALSKIKTTMYRQYLPFPYEGSVLYPNRHKQFLEEAQGHPLVDKKLGELRPILKKVNKVIGEADPYTAVIVADGDRMGKLISGISEMERHKAFSKKLAEFASRAKTVVEKKQGCLVYSGGDDVLALVPVDTCLECAHDLQVVFRNLLNEFDCQDKSPTLSVGIALGHCLEPLEDLLNYGRQAEHSAKRPDHNGLAIHVHTRGGAPIRIRGRWDSPMYEGLQKWIKLHRKNGISDTAAYELNVLADDYTDWKIGVEKTKEAIKADIERLLKRKRPGGRGIDPDDLDELTRYLFRALQEVGHEKDLDRAVKQWARELIIARRFARSKDQAEGPVSAGKGGTS